MWLSVRCYGRVALPPAQRRWLSRHCGDANRLAWTRPIRRRQAPLHPFLDLLNRPAGGEAYWGGPLLLDPVRDWPIRHFRGEQPIDRPLEALLPGGEPPHRLAGRQFWCGPLAFHFGHQIADFGSRLLLASLDPRGGELLWYPWKAAQHWSELKPWQRTLLWYLNPGGKPHRIATGPLIAEELVVWPQQARMRAVPTAAHLEALSWCERRLPSQGALEAVYVSRSRFASCTSADTLLGAFAAEAVLEQLLRERGVRVIHPECLPLEQQLQIYKDAQLLIVAEGSAQHGLELLGYHRQKVVVLLCRRPQKPGMALPLLARFPRLQVVAAVQQLWFAQAGVSWNGLALLDWHAVAEALNPWLAAPLRDADLANLERAGRQQLRALSEAGVSLQQLLKRP